MCVCVGGWSSLWSCLTRGLCVSQPIQLLPVTHTSIVADGFTNGRQVTSCCAHLGPAVCHCAVGSGLLPAPLPDVWAGDFAKPWRLRQLTALGFTVVTVGQSLATDELTRLGQAGLQNSEFSPQLCGCRTFIRDVLQELPVLIKQS